MAIDTQKRNKRQYEWQKNSADRINFLLPKGYKAIINETAKEHGMTASELIREAIEDKLQNLGVKVELQSAGDVVE